MHEIFPTLDTANLQPTKAVLHGYARTLGSWLKANRSQRKHWWHASLRPSLLGVTTGPIYAGPGFEFELDLRASKLRMGSANGALLNVPLVGQSVAQFAVSVRDFLRANGVASQANGDDQASADDAGEDYSLRAAAAIGQAITAVSRSMVEFRASIREECSPIQLWPHHFDLSMLWLPGQIIDGKDPQDAEQSDKQMNFGFAFGDESVTEPYFYVTAYPSPGEMSGVKQPSPARWHTNGFTGALLLYRDLVAQKHPAEFLLDWWQTMLSAGQKYLHTTKT